MSKLVRDRIPEIMARSGCPGKFEIAWGRAYLQALKDKLQEEASEAAAATSPEELAMELADVLEALETLAAAAGLDWKDIRACQGRKRGDRGGFAGGILLARATSPPTDGLSTASP